MWNVAKPGRHCWAFASSYLPEVLGFYISHSVSTTVLDFVVFLLPVNFFFSTIRRRIRALRCFACLGLDWCMYFFFLLFFPAPKQPELTVFWK